MNYTCKVCGSLRRSTSLSVPNPDCGVCDLPVCGSCQQIRCNGCRLTTHMRCSFLLRGDYYCRPCTKTRLIEALQGEPLENQLMASLDYEELKRRKVS